MDLKKLLDIARILDGIDLSKYDGKGGLNTTAFLVDCNARQTKELIKVCGSDIKNVLSDYTYELSSVTPEEIETKEIAISQSVYQMVTNYIYILTKAGFNPEIYTIKDAKELIGINNIEILKQNLTDARSSMTQESRAKFEYLMKKFKIEENNFKDITKLNELIDEYRGT